MNVTIDVTSFPSNTSFKINLSELDIEDQEWLNLSDNEKQQVMEDYMTYTTDQPKWILNNIN